MQSQLEVNVRRRADHVRHAPYKTRAIRPPPSRAAPSRRDGTRRETSCAPAMCGWSRHLRAISARSRAWRYAAQSSTKSASSTGSLRPRTKRHAVDRGMTHPSPRTHLSFCAFHSALMPAMGRTGRKHGARIGLVSLWEDRFRQSIVRACCCDGAPGYVVVVAPGRQAELDT